MTRSRTDFDESSPDGRRIVITPFDLEESDWSDQFDSIVELTLDGSEPLDILFFYGQSTRMFAVTWWSTW